MNDLKRTSRKASRRSIRLRHHKVRERSKLKSILCLLLPSLIREHIKNYLNFLLNFVISPLLQSVCSQEKEILRSLRKTSLGLQSGQKFLNGLYFRRVEKWFVIIGFLKQIFKEKT